MRVKIVGGHGGVSPGFKTTSYLIDGKLLIDAGSVAEGIPIAEQVKIDHILISHPHLDHIKDLAFISDNCFGMKGKPFEVYTHKTVKDAIMKHLLNDIIWPDFTKLPNKKNPTLRINELKPEKVIRLGEYSVCPILVNHPSDAMGFIVEKEGKSILFTQDTGPTDRIWEVARKLKNLVAIFTEVSFPNELEQVAIDSFHHTPKTLAEEIKKMPENVPLYLGHLKPNFQEKLYEQVEELRLGRVTLLGSDLASFNF